VQTARPRARLSDVGHRIMGIPTFAAIRTHLPIAALVAAALIPVSAIAGYSRTLVLSGLPTDYPLFGPTGADLLRGRWDLVFASPRNAAGPFELVPYGIAFLLHVHGPVAWTIFYTVALTILVFLLSLATLAAAGSANARTRFYVTLGLGAVAILLGFLPTAMFSGHPADLMIPLLWMFGAALARDRSFLACGVVIGVSVGFESWGVLGFVVVFVVLAPRLISTAVAGVATIAVIYGPFVATGVFRVFGFHWPIFTVSIYAVVFPHLHQFTWALRALQAAVAVLAGWGVALLTRRTRYAVWLVPLAIIAARLVADPLLLNYYWVAPAAVALSGLAAAIYARAWVAAGVATILVGWFWFPRPQPFISAALMLLVVVVCAIVARRTEAPTAQSHRP
jgi:hypothetical protein